MHISLDDLHFTAAYDVEEDTTISEPTGNTLNRFKFSIRFSGNQLQNELSDILNKPSFSFKTLGEQPSAEFRAKKENYSWSYTGNEFNDDITATIELKELDKDLPEDHDLLSMISTTAIMNWIRTRALSSILIKKGICTEDEYSREIEEIADRDFENLRALIAYGKPEPEIK